MTTTHQLTHRARMILSDGKKHAPQVLEWARSQIQRADFIACGFTLREQSLGAQ